MDNNFSKVLSEQQCPDDLGKANGMFIKVGHLILNLNDVKYFCYEDNDKQIRFSYGQNHWGKIDAKIFEQYVMPHLKIIASVEK